MPNQATTSPDAQPAHLIDPARALLRHAVATVAYRAAKTVRDTPERFAGFVAGPTTRTPEQILAHMVDLFDWALTMARGPTRWHDSSILPWDEQLRRFFASLEAFDAYLASGEPLATSAERLFQGPVADALTHVGQLAMLRRLAGGPVRGESYAKADITAGRTSFDQPPPRVEFD
jgi:hypothetical protein